MTTLHPRGPWLLPQTKSLGISIFKTRSPEFEESVDRFLRADPQAPSAFWVLANPNGLVFGFSSYFGLKSLPGEACLGWVAIAPEYRGAGMGKRLLNATVNAANQMGYSTIRAIVPADLAHEHYLGLLARRGFMAESDDGLGFTDDTVKVLSLHCPPSVTRPWALAKWGVARSLDVATFPVRKIA